MTEDQILQVSNDISEGMLSSKVTKAQLVEVVKYFREQLDREIQRKNSEMHEKLIEFLEVWRAK